jgi:hypothetical protein
MFAPKLVLFKSLIRIEKTLMSKEKIFLEIEVYLENSI